MNYIAIAVLGILFILKLLFLMLTFHNGFDIGDEGMHMLLYKYPQEYAITIHNYHYLVTALFPPSLITVFNLRMAWLVTELTGGLILLLGCISFMRSIGINISKATAVLFFMFGANALALSIQDRIIAYNSLSNFFLYTSAGLLLLALNPKKYTGFCRLLIAGAFFFTTLQFFIKPTAAFGAAAMELILCMVFFNRNRIDVLLCAIAGIVVAMAVMFSWILPPFNIWWNNYLQGIELAHISGYGSKLMLLDMYVLPTLCYLLLLLIPNLIICFLIKRIFIKQAMPPEYLPVMIIAGHIVSCVIVWFVLYLLFSFRHYSFETLQVSPENFYSLILLLPNTLVYQYLSGRMKLAGQSPPAFDWRVALVCFFLLVVPYLIFFGAFSSFDISIYGHLLPVMALLFMLPYLFTGPILLSQVKGHYLIFVTLLCSYFFMKHYIFYPTRILQPLSEERVNVSESETVLMDSASASFVSQLKQKVNAMGSFKYATQIGMHPGLVYLLGLKQPGNYYYLSFSFINHDIENMNAAYNDYFYRKFFKEIIQGPLIINAGISARDIKALNNRMVENGYNLLQVDSLYNPYLEREKLGNHNIKNPFTYMYMAIKTKADR